MNIKDRIETTISTLGVSQNKFAQMTGVDQSVISRAIRGERSITVATLEKLWPFLVDNQPRNGEDEA